MLKKYFTMLAILFMSSATYATTLAEVKENGQIRCGVSDGSVGFSSVDSKGVWVGIDVDVCRSVAAAVLGDAQKVKFVPLTAKERFAALQSGEVELLSRNTTWTQTRDTNLGLTFAGVNYYDGQGFMVKKSLGVTKLNELNGATFCLQAGTTTELNLTDYFRSHNMQLMVITTDSMAQTKNGYESGRCDAVTTDQSALVAMRSTLANPDDSLILGEIISKEPLGPVVRADDNGWLKIVRWTLNAMISAEELNITSVNYKDKSTNPEVNRLLGRSGKLHEHLGLDKNWASNIIAQVGNYGQSFERNLGVNTPLKIARGLNAQWKDGGILYSPPFR